MPDDPKSRTARLLTLLALTAALVVPPAPALGAQDPVPDEVIGYASDPNGLLARLDDQFGVSVAGQGLDFRDSAQAGPLAQVWSFTPAFLSGEDAGAPVRRANLWTAPITVDAVPVGLATIWIDPGTGDPDVADFVVSRSIAEVLSRVPAGAQLVFDRPRGAWFALLGGRLEALVPGSSGVTGSTTLADYRAMVGDAPPAQAADASGLIGGGVLMGAAAIGIVLLQLVPRLRARRGDPVRSDEPA